MAIIDLYLWQDGCSIIQSSLMSIHLFVARHLICVLDWHQWRKIVHDAAKPRSENDWRQQTLEDHQEQPGAAAYLSMHRASHLAFNAPTEVLSWDDLRKTLHGGQRMATMQNSEEILSTVSTPWAGRTNVTLQTTDRQTDGFAIAKTQTLRSDVRVKIEQVEMEFNCM